MHYREETWQTEDGTALFARTWRPEGESLGTLVIVHGLGEHSGRYEHVADYFTRAGWEVRAFDLRGHGRSPGRRGCVPSYQYLLEDIRGFTHEACREQEGRPVALWGHSMGGNLVLNFVIQGPDLACPLLVLATGPLVLPRHPPPAWKRWMGRLMSRVWPSFIFATQIESKWLSRSEEARQNYDADPLKFQQISARLATEALDAGRQLLESTPHFAVPTLLMHGTGDRITDCQATARLAEQAGPKCDFKSWEGLYHELHWEPERAEVLDFMAQWIEAKLATEHP